MTKLEKETLADLIKGMSLEEQEFITRFILTEFLLKELDRRCCSVTRKLNNINDLLESLDDNSSLEDMQKVLVSIKGVAE